MLLADFVTALIIAIFFSFILLAIFGRGAWGIPFVFILLIIFGITWAGGVWITPFGPTIYGSYWLGFLLIGFIAAVVFAAIIPSGRSTRKSMQTKEQQSEARPAEPDVTAVGNFFWILIVIFFIILLIYYL